MTILEWVFLAPSQTVWFYSVLYRTVLGKTVKEMWTERVIFLLGTFDKIEICAQAPHLQDFSTFFFLYFYQSVTYIEKCTNHHGFSQAPQQFAIGSIFRA